MPPAVVLSGACALVLPHRRVALDIPPVARGCRTRAELPGDGEVARRRTHPCKERLPQSRDLLLIQSLAHQLQFQCVVGADCDLLAPVGVEKTLRVEPDKAREEFLEGGIRARLDGSPRGAKKLRQLVSAQGEACDDTEAAAATALQGPEEIGITAGVRNAHPAVGGHHFGFEQSASARAESLGEAAEAATLYQAGDAHRGAA